MTAGQIVLLGGAALVAFKLLEKQTTPAVAGRQTAQTPASSANAAASTGGGGGGGGALQTLKNTGSSIFDALVRSAGQTQPTYRQQYPLPPSVINAGGYQPPDYDSLLNRVGGSWDYPTLGNWPTSDPVRQTSGTPSYSGGGYEDASTYGGAPPPLRVV